MGPHKVASPSEEDALSDVESHSDQGSNASENSSSVHEGSDSDSLDSFSPRKKRRVSVDNAPLLSQTLAPSRIKISKSLAINPVNDDPKTSILAPTDASTTFESLNVKPWLVGSLKAMAIRRPTGIQKGCIPEILKGRDCIGGSRTGSGKTVAFSVPILQKWAEDPVGIFALILTPTR